MKPASTWGHEIERFVSLGIGDLHCNIQLGVELIIRDIQKDAILHAAEVAEKMASQIGADDPATGELSDENMHRAQGAYQTAETVKNEAEKMERYMCGACGCEIDMDGCGCNPQDA